MSRQLCLPCSVKPYRDLPWLVLSPVTPPGMKILSPLLGGEEMKAFARVTLLVLQLAETSASLRAHFSKQLLRQGTLTPCHVDEKVAPSQLENEPSSRNARVINYSLLHHAVANHTLHSKEPIGGLVLDTPLSLIALRLQRFHN